MYILFAASAVLVHGILPWSGIQWVVDHCPLRIISAFLFELNCSVFGKVNSVLFPIMSHHFYFVSLIFFGVATLSHAQYYGKLIGQFTRQGNTESEHHNVAGTVYAVDDNTLQIIGFTYDGQAPDAFFWIGTSSSPDTTGTKIPKALGAGNEKLGSYSDDNLVIHLDSPGTIQSFKWISIWCVTANANFADVYIPTNFVPPAPKSLGALGFSPRVHDVSATDVIILNTKQIRFEGLTYDGRGPDAYFWLDVTPNPTRYGMRVPQVGESTASKLNQRLSGVIRTVHLPGDYTVFDIANIGLWCVLARQDFGHIDIPTSLMAEGSIVPFSVSEETACTGSCAVLQDDMFQVKWRVDGPDMVICLSSRVSLGQYMSFGLSGSNSSTDMDESDVVVAWIDQQSLEPRVEDYYLQSRQQCVRNTGVGVCPDTLQSGANDATLVGSYILDGITNIIYRRPLAATDSELDKAISTSSAQYISWAYGPINADMLATYHSDRTGGNQEINFGQTDSTCPAFTGTTGAGDGPQPFEVPPIKALTETTFRCDIGQAGGVKGYQGITGSVGWGIAWYIDGDLIPEITVKRNVTYTFEVFGGDDPTQSASYHPFYITNSGQGGYDQLTAAERVGHEIYAGPVDGSYCYYDETSETPADIDNIASYNAYRSTLALSCPAGDSAQPGILVWTPDSNTPDEVYYQCYTHRFLGWKIKVTDDASVEVFSSVVMVTSLLFAIFMM